MRRSSLRSALANALPSARGWALLLVGALALPGRSDADELAAAGFVRTDSDGTTVYAPRVRAAVLLDEDRTRVEAAYTADIWTSASIDIRTAATRAVHEQRDELALSVSRALDETTIGGGYRVSIEPDYVSHGGSLRLAQELGEGAATLEAALNASWDVVGRSGDQGFARGLGTVGGRATYTQILDPHTILQGSYEVARRDGYLASPYRFVGVGGDGLCAGSAVLCLPESHPGLRTRHAFAARFRRSLGGAGSLGATYRLYLDDWGLVSHTALASAAWLPFERTTLSLGYRFYRQSAATFYRARYGVPSGQILYVTRDKELSAMFHHRLELAWEQRIDLTDAGPELRTTFVVGGARLDYDDFVGLDRVYALDVTVGAEVTL